MCIQIHALVSMRVALGIACMAMVTSPSLAQAGDPTATQTPAETAEARHRAGVAAYAKGQYPDAIELFLEANRLRPSAALSFNVARSYDQIHDASSALAWYRDYRRRSNRAGESKEIAGHIARLEKRLAQKGVQQVYVASSPHGATVLIDRTPVGVSPWTGDLAPGAHSVALTLRGFEDASQYFDLPGDHALDIVVALTPKRVPEQSQRSVAADIPPVVPVQRAPVRTIVRATPKHEESSTLTTLGWTSLGAGGAALGGALVFELLRRDAEEDAQLETRQIQFSRDIESMRSRQTLARVFGGVGAALAATGGILLLVSLGDNEHVPDARVALSCAQLRCGASVKGRF